VQENHAIATEPYVQRMNLNLKFLNLECVLLEAIHNIKASNDINFSDPGKNEQSQTPV
jgi:hypothetical protein